MLDGSCNYSRGNGKIDPATGEPQLLPVFLCSDETMYKRMQFLLKCVSIYSESVVFPLTDRA